MAEKNKLVRGHKHNINSPSTKTTIVRMLAADT